ncbi:hypothetical protein C1I95_30545 [Micromonospora craterilacus]|uniref:Uncharacterized protein n=1 Tax=Micromonospora craterilacus TaxID=1655439 RepID=A0A2W2E779_9ACTN|nr:hypothetical protein [Micromonospora craterilacus]PZG07848.1 hypothetical protein C1I95_30545 [Micromonospora craterilacus]
METADAQFVAQRLQRIALEKISGGSISLNASADLRMFGIVLGRRARQFKNAFRVHIPDGLDLNQITGAMLAPEDRREMYIEVRRTALKKLERCRSTNINAWSTLWGAWIDFIVAERVVSRWWPAEYRSTAERTEEVGLLFDEEQYRSLSKQDSELEEAFADIFSAMMVYASDEAQEELHGRLLEVCAEHGKLRARTRLREMRQQFQVSPWNFVRWEAELRTGSPAGAEPAVEQTPAEPASAAEPPSAKPATVAELPDEPSPVHILARWVEARWSRDSAGLASLLDELLEWGRTGSPIERAVALSEAAGVIAQTDLSTGYGAALTAGDAIDVALAGLPDAELQAVLHDVLAPTLNNILEVLLAASKPMGDSVDRGAYAWIRRLHCSPDLPEALRELGLRRLIAHYQGTGEATMVWRVDRVGYDHRFLTLGEQSAAGWRFMFEPGGSVAMDPFRFSKQDVAVLRRPPGRARTAAERDALRKALFGPWIGFRLEVGLSFPGAVLVRRSEELSSLDLTWLGGTPGDEEPVWPALDWFDRLDDTKLQ